MVDQQIKNKDVLTEFKDWYLTSKQIQTPYHNPLMFIDGICGLTLYRKKQFQVQLFICEPNVVIPEHIHPNIDSFELFLYGMKFTHNGEVAISENMALTENDGIPTMSYETIRVKPDDWHGGVSSKKGGSFISIQHWINNKKPTHVSADWKGNIIGEKHKQQIEDD